MSENEQRYCGDGSAHVPHDFTQDGRLFHCHGYTGIAALVVMPTIVEFLLARISEEELLAQELLDRGMPYPYEDSAVEAEWDFAVVHNPKRVLADCASKRKIIAEHASYNYGLVDWCRMCVDPVGFGGSKQHLGVVFPCRTLRYLAAPYSDHVDFDDAWSVDL